jgi:hypothetical protein
MRYKYGAKGSENKCNLILNMSVSFMIRWKCVSCLRFLTVLIEYWLGRLALSKLQSHFSKSYIHFMIIISINTM